MKASADSTISARIRGALAPLIVLLTVLLLASLPGPQIGAQVRQKVADQSLQIATAAHAPALYGRDVVQGLHPLPAVNPEIQHFDGGDQREIQIALSPEPAAPIEAVRPPELRARAPPCPLV